MLNEIWRLWRALQTAGIQAEAPHPLIRPLYDPRGNQRPENVVKMMLRVRLDGQGHVAAVEDVAPDELASLWRIVKTSDGSFPVLKVNQPILSISQDSDIWDKFKKEHGEPQKIALLSQAFCNHEIRQWAESGWKWGDSLQKAALLHDKLDGDGVGAAIATLSDRFKIALQDAKAINTETGSVALKALSQNRLSQLEAVRQMLVGKGKDSRKISILLVLDLEEAALQHVPIYDRRMRQRVGEILPTNLAAKEREHCHRALRSSFGGEGTLLKEPFPAVKLPILKAYFPLVSMASDDDKPKCNKRYGLTEYTIVPVTKEEALRMQDALEWIVAKERQGRTWRGVANGKYEKAKKGKTELNDLLIVYVDGKPEIHANVANLFGTDEKSQRTQFEVDAQAVCKALDGLKREKPGSKLNLFLLRKASKGQAQVALAESLKVDDVIEAAQRWQKAAANVPEVTLPLPGEKGEKEIQGRPRTPYPDQVVRLLSEEWVTSGTRSIKAHGIGIGEVLDLMLRKPDKWEPAAQHMLELTLGRLGPLLLGVFGAMHINDEKHWKPYTLQIRQTALDTVSILGILLGAFNRWKETYMSKIAFEVGRLLSLADTLHREYCKQVRGGHIPPQLIGNALMPAAADNPQDAVDRLRERVIIYKAWADKGDDEEYRLAKWAVGQMGQICQQLAQTPLPTETDQPYRAELFLGYMARFPNDKSQVGEIEP